MKILYTRKLFTDVDEPLYVKLCSPFESNRPKKNDLIYGYFRLICDRK